MFVIYLNTHAFFTAEKKLPHMSEKVRFNQYKYLASTNTLLASDWWRSWMWGRPPWFLKKHVHELVRGMGEAGCASGSPGWPRLGPAHNWEMLRDPLGISTQSRRINGNRQPPCQRRKVLAEARQNKTATEHLPTRVLFFFVTRHATSRVTFCHAKMKSWIKFLVC